MLVGADETEAESGFAMQYNGNAGNLIKLTPTVCYSWNKITLH